MDIKKVIDQTQVRFANFLIKRFFIILIFFILLILGVGFYFGIYPKYKLYTLYKNVELPQQERMLELEKIKLENLQTSKIEFSKYEQSEQIQKLSKILPSKKDIANLFVLMETVAKEGKFTLLSVNVSEDLSGTVDVGETASQTSIEIHKIRVNLTLEGGSYESLKRFLSVVEQNLQIMDINSLSFTPNLLGSTGYFIVLTTYYIAE